MFIIVSGHPGMDLMPSKMYILLECAVVPDLLVLACVHGAMACMCQNSGPSTQGPALGSLGRWELRCYPYVAGGHILHHVLKGSHT